MRLTATNLIDRSASRGRVVVAPRGPKMWAAIAAECGGQVESADGAVDLWGVLAGAPWRVRLLPGDAPIVEAEEIAQRPVGRPHKGERVRITARISAVAAEALERLQLATGGSQSDVIEAAVLALAAASKPAK